MFLDQAGKFKGLIPARSLYDQLRIQNLDIVNILETADIKSLKGLISSSITNTGSKRDALEKMARENLSELPVTDEDGHFTGIIQRDKLTSSILLDLVTERT